MSVWAIVPIKPLERSKSRLSQVLTRHERARFSQQMLVRTLQVLAESARIEKTLVISRDSRALSIARSLGAHTVTEHGHPDLNDALKRATAFASDFSVSAILILPADLPLLSKESIAELTKHINSNRTMVVVPDRRGTGTNALLLSPPGLIELGYGEGSFDRHVQRGRAAGVDVEIVEHPDLGLDIDFPEDLDYLLVTHPEMKNQFSME